MGEAGGRGQQEAGVASGWNLWVWLECIGVSLYVSLSNVHVSLNRILGMACNQHTTLSTGFQAWFTLVHTLEALCKPHYVLYESR